MHLVPLARASLTHEAIVSTILLNFNSLSFDEFYTLMKCRKSFFSDKLSNQILFYKINKSRRYLSTSAIQQHCLENRKRNLNPWFVTGFADAESNFTITILRNNKLEVGSVQARFQISLHPKDKALLENIQSYFGGVAEVFINQPGGLLVRRATNIFIIVFNL